MFETKVYLAGHYVCAYSNSKEAEAMLSFLFGDIQNPKNVSNTQLEARFSLLEIDHTWRVSKLGKPENDETNNQSSDEASNEPSDEIYQSPHLTDAANFLMGEVVFHLIKNNQKQMAVHAGFLSDEHGGILLPAESGSGKSSLSIWMTLNGYAYHTDELVLIEPKSHKTQAFTRPFNIKKHGVEAIDRLIDIQSLEPEAKSGDFITMIPHRALNSNFKADSPSISRILFPKYGKESSNNLTKLSGAAAGIELMKCNVIARNLPGHGFAQLLDIVKSIPAYQLTYNHFDALPELLTGLKPA